MDNSMLLGVGAGVLFFMLTKAKKKKDSGLDSFLQASQQSGGSYTPPPPSQTPSGAGAWYQQPVIVPTYTSLAQLTQGADLLRSNLYSTLPSNRCYAIQTALGLTNEALKALALIYYDRHNKSITEDVNSLNYACLYTNDESDLINRLSALGVQ